MTSLTRRLLPLHAGVALQSFVLWYPVEKLFMSEIGFDAASVGAMAAAYAVVVPLFEVPSGVLADRWSRRGVLVVASVALAVCSLVGGLSTTVPAYIAGVLALGLYFAMYTGTLDAIVYDTVLEETEGSSDFERRLGRVRFVESVALVGSSLAGGVLAGLLDTRATYFLTIPFALASIACYLRFREPTLHRAEVRTPLRAHLTTTFRAAHRRLVPVIALAVLAAVLTQVVFEFGPLWLVALGVPAVLYGPYWAGLMATLGIGGLLVGQLTRPSRLAGTGVVLTGAVVVLSVSHDFAGRGRVAAGRGRHPREQAGQRRDPVDRPRRGDVRSQLAVVAGVPAVLAAVRPDQRRERGAQGGVAARRGRGGGDAAASGPSSRTACGRARR
jgi:MFS family permease